MALFGFCCPSLELDSLWCKNMCVVMDPWTDSLCICWIYFPIEHVRSISYFLQVLDGWLWRREKTDAVWESPRSTELDFAFDRESGSVKVDAKVARLWSIIATYPSMGYLVE